MISSSPPSAVSAASVAEGPAGPACEQAQQNVFQHLGMDFHAWHDAQGRVALVQLAQPRHAQQHQLVVENLGGKRTVLLQHFCGGDKAAGIMGGEIDPDPAIGLGGDGEFADCHPDDGAVDCNRCWGKRVAGGDPQHFQAPSPAPAAPKRARPWAAGGRCHRCRHPAARRPCHDRGPRRSSSGRLRLAPSNSGNISGGSVRILRRLKVRNCGNSAGAVIRLDGFRVRIGRVLFHAAHAQNHRPGFQHRGQ